MQQYTPFPLPPSCSYLSSGEEVQEEKELQQKLGLVQALMTLDQTLICFFNPDDQLSINYQSEFRRILLEKIPSDKKSQLEVLERLARCFYTIIAYKKYQSLIPIEASFIKYLKYATFRSKLIDGYEGIREWLKRLSIDSLTRSRLTLLSIRNRLQKLNEPRLEILLWRVKLCLMLLAAILEKPVIQRTEVVAVLKPFRNLRNEGKITDASTWGAFQFITRSLISTHSDAYIFYEREIKVWRQEVNQESMCAQMDKLLSQCQRATRSLFSTISQRTLAANNGSKIQKLSLNRLQGREIAVSGQFVRRRLSREKEQLFCKKIDHFFKSRDNAAYHSTESTKRASTQPICLRISNKHSTSLHSISRFTFDQAVVLKNALQTSKEQHNQTAKSVKRMSMNGRKQGLSFLKHGKTRRTRHAYMALQKEVGGRAVITNRQLQDEAENLTLRRQQRCKITFEEILVGQLSKREIEQTNVKFVGASEDNQFSNLSFRFYSIFNQELAEIWVQMRRSGKQGYVVRCSVSSTYCRHRTVFRLGKKEQENFSLEQLIEHVSGSIIYYEALQQRVERKMGVGQLQAMEELMRQYKGIELSQTQITKVLSTIDLLQNFFFWYYTKSNFINGCRLEPRANIDFVDLSAFAVSLGKFKSDFDSCLNEIILVQNTRSLVQACAYLSHGRKIVYKAIRKVKGQLYFEVIKVSGEVYKNFCRRDRQPFFKNAELCRCLIKLNITQGQTGNGHQGNQTFYQEQFRSTFNLQECLKQEEVFTFFMKNIVENFLEIKHLRMLEMYLKRISHLENYEVFSGKGVSHPKKHSVEVLADEQVNEMKEFKMAMNSSIKHLKLILVSYCEVYKLNPYFAIRGQTHHSIKIRGAPCIIKEISLKNGMNILKIYKRQSEKNYNLLLYHQDPMPIVHLETPFYNRFVMLRSEQQYFANLIRLGKAQTKISNDLRTVTKAIIKLKSGFYYAAISQCPHIFSWRIDYYCPESQTQHSTFLDEELYLECLGQPGENENMWRQAIVSFQPNFLKGSLKFHTRHLKMFRSMKRLYFGEEKVKGNLELIELQGQLWFLICEFQSGCVSVGKVENVIFLSKKDLDNKSKERTKVYGNIMIQLYYKLVTGKLPSQPINTDYFLQDSSF